MSQKPIREYAGKKFISTWMKQEELDERYNTLKKMFFVTPETDLDKVESPFDSTTKLVAKPDQLVKRRGKLGLVYLNKTFEECINWIKEKRGQKLTIGKSTDHLNYFLIEPFVAHELKTEELYICIHSIREGDEILFYHAGGVDVGDVDSKAVRYLIKPCTKYKKQDFIENILNKSELNIKNDKYLTFLSEFLYELYRMYTKLHFAYLEINPLVVKQDMSGIYILDLAAKLDSCATSNDSLMSKTMSSWESIKQLITEYPPFFGHVAKPEEQLVAELDDKTGASLKLTVLNENGRVWTLVAGGGASVIYADTICGLGYSSILGNYGEYSGSPNRGETRKYSEIVINLLLKSKYNEPNKPPILLIGGGIANFTDVADTFKGIIDSLKDKQDELRAKNTLIYVRRGGPNYQAGLDAMKKCAIDFNLNIEVYGPEEHITSIVGMALNDDSNSDLKEEDLNDINLEEAILQKYESQKHLYSWPKNAEELKENDRSEQYVMTNKTRSILYVNPNNLRPIQNMLDFDYLSRRTIPSVSAVVYGKTSKDYIQLYYGKETIIINVYTSIELALEADPLVDTVVNFASRTSAYRVTRDILTAHYDRIRHISIIAEGIPERQTKELKSLSDENNVVILGPSTVGGIKAGIFRIGNTGGRIKNIKASKLYSPGPIAFVSRSGGLSNELSNIIHKVTTPSAGVNEGMAIGGDRYPCTTFVDHLIRYNAEESCKLLVILGEVGGILEYDIIRAIESKKLTKPIIAWCTGTCAESFEYDVQFGHAGALAQSELEKANNKNLALRKAGCFVPETFDSFDKYIEILYNKLKNDSIIIPSVVIKPPEIPVDYQWAQKLGIIRKSTGFLSGISDERGDELVYGGVTISDVFTNNVGIGGVISLLWFRRSLPSYFTAFIEIVLQITADHGPAVSGAHNTIVTARAGKDLVSSLCSGLLTIGPRFGGALHEAAKYFNYGVQNGLSPQAFIDYMYKIKPIPGIGHKVKSADNPDKRCEIIQKYAEKNIPKKNRKTLDFALNVAKKTTKKKSNLILNVDGMIAVCFVDLFRLAQEQGLFTEKEVEKYLFEMDTLNALFVLGRSIGFIGHYLDQKRLGQGLYRHPTDDIHYMNM